MLVYCAQPWREVQRKWAESFGDGPEKTDSGVDFGKSAVSQIRRGL